MKLSFHCTVPAPIEEVYEHVTAMGPAGPIDRVLFVQKYGEFVEEVDGAVLTHDTDDDDDTMWLSAFTYPNRRTMEAIESSWSDREDVFETVKGGTRWTVTFNPKSRALHGLVQWLYFLSVGKYRVGVPVLSPVVQHFRRKAREESEAAEDPESDEPPPAQAS